LPQLASLTVQDGQATPANHTFNPFDIRNNVATLTESTGVPIGDRRLTLSVTKTASGRYKATFKLAIPIVQDNLVNGVTKPAVVRTSYIDVVATFDSSSSLQERKDAISMMRTAFTSKPLVDGVFLNLEGVF
jgi:hypothetical protein